MKHIIATIVGLMFLSSLYAKGYNIELNVKGEKEKDAYMAIHIGAGRFAIDTARLDKKGKGVFTSDKPLAPGMYLIVIEGAQMADFLVPDTINQNFTISLTAGKSTETLSFTNSPENEAFAEYTRYFMNKQKREMELMKNASLLKEDKAAIASIDAELDSINDVNNKKVEELGKQYPNSLFYNVISAMRPARPRNADLPDSAVELYMYRYYRNHYWDHIALDDKRMQNTPILIPALEGYFNTIIPQIPDTIIAEFDKVMAKTNGNKDMMRFIAGHMFNQYYKSKIMGMESVVVHIIDDYYLTGKIATNDEKFMHGIEEYAGNHRATLIGKKAQNLKMESINGMFESLYDVDAQYTLVYFYEPTCGHCKQETPRINKLYEQYKDKGFAVFGVYTQQNKTEWLNYVAENELNGWINVWDPENSNNYRVTYNVSSVPQMFLLDKDKKIIGRRLDNGALGQMLGHLFKDK